MGRVLCRLCGRPTACVLIPLEVWQGDGAESAQARISEVVGLPGQRQAPGAGMAQGTEGGRGVRGSQGSGKVTGLSGLRRTGRAWLMVRAGHA